MKPFKFFQKPVKGDLSMLGGQTFATMSYDDTYNIVRDTPTDHYAMRRLYHTNPEEYRRRTNERYYIAEMTGEMANRINGTPEPKSNWYQRVMKIKNWFNDMWGVIIYGAMVLSFFILLFNVI